MIQIKFRNLEKSELARSAVMERIGAVVEKFDLPNLSRIVVTLEMENSPKQAGPDVFKVKVHIPTGKFKGLTVTKSASNLYKALAEVVDHMLEKLNRTGDRDRVRKRTQARLVAQME